LLQQAIKQGATRPAASLLACSALVASLLDPFMHDEHGKADNYTFIYTIILYVAGLNNAAS
jgi:hypothetical protein